MTPDSRANADQGWAAKPKRQRAIRQSDIPGVTLEQALRVPQALSDQYAKQPARPLDVAVALDMSPSSGPFRTLCGAAVGYGLTDGGPNAKEIALTELGRRVVGPLIEGDDAQAMREAVLTPTVQREFLDRYDGSPLPAEGIALNVLETLGVPVKSTERFYGIIRSNAEKVGFITVIKEKEYIDLHKTMTESQELEADHAQTSPADVDPEAMTNSQEVAVSAPPQAKESTDRGNHSVFIAAEIDDRIAAPLKQLLAFGGLEPVTANEDDSLLTTIERMQSASSAVIHARSRVGSVEGPKQIPFDPGRDSSHLAFELGAAIALHGSRVVVLTEEGAELPPGLPDLDIVEYSSAGLNLDDITTIAKVLNPQ